MSDTVVVVDDNDNIVKIRPRSEQKPDERTRMTVTWVQNTKGDLLIAQRSHHKKNYPNLWGPACAGTVEDGESYEQNAIKELEEELGLTGFPLQEMQKVLWDGGPGDIRMGMCYMVTCDWPAKKFKLQETEVDAVRWISKKDLVHELTQTPEIFLSNTMKWLTLLHLVD